MKIAILFSSFSPYHYARTSAFQKVCETKGHTLIPVAITAPALRHQWTPSASFEVEILCENGSDGDVSPREISVAWMRFLRGHKPGVVVLAGYWPFSIALLGLLAMARGIPRILMTESHSATGKRSGISGWAKRTLVRSYSAALVGGIPHRKYLEGLGFNPRLIQDGYDCVDNDFFWAQAEGARADAEGNRRKYQLPRNYFLNVARLVPKKNISMLLAAYAMYLKQAGATAFHLVHVGDGPLASEIRGECARLDLPVRDLAGVSFEGTARPVESEGAQVTFYGSRRIDELPAFFGLASCFVLPSLEEEWGLVVNEAMASGLPVMVSEAAGCASDLLPRNAGAKPGLRDAGIVFDPHTPETLAASFRQMASSDSARKAMGQNARERVSGYGLQRFGNNLMRLVEEVAPR